MDAEADAVTIETARAVSTYHRPTRTPRTSSQTTEAHGPGASNTYQPWPRPRNTPPAARTVTRLPPSPPPPPQQQQQQQQQQKPLPRKRAPPLGATNLLRQDRLPDFRGAGQPAAHLRWVDSILRKGRHSNGFSMKMVELESVKLQHEHV